MTTRIITDSNGRKHITNEPRLHQADEIHSCSLYCDRPGCINAQRDELREKLVVMTKACEHYEAALLETYPYGAKGKAWEQWNEARKLLREQT